jgi:hypothetical protein
MPSATVAAAAWHVTLRMKNVLANRPPQKDFRSTSTTMVTIGSSDDFSRFQRLLTIHPFLSQARHEDSTNSQQAPPLLPFPIFLPLSFCRPPRFVHPFERFALDRIFENSTFHVTMNSFKMFPLFAALALMPLVSARASQPPITIQSITYGGSGSPQGSVGQSLSNDRRTYTLIFDSFVASSGPTVPITESRKDSQINLNLSGKGNDALDQTIRGYVQLPAGASATVTIIMDDQDHPKKSQINQATFFGPVSKDYLLDTLFKIKQHGGVSPAVFHVNITIQSANHNASGQVTVDSLDGKFIDKGGHADDDENDDDADND